MRAVHLLNNGIIGIIYKQRLFEHRATKRILLVAYHIIFLFMPIAI